VFSKRSWCPSRAISTICSLAGFAALMLFAPGAGAQAACRVLDSELAGTYQGGCKDGFAQGYGEAKGTAEYRGDFRAGRKHGQSVKIWPSGDRYSGSWENDEITGAPTPMMIAQARAKAEALLAVGTPGVKVCRALLVGIAVRDWIRAEVLEVSADRIKVRIDDPGQQPHVIDGKPLVKGMAIWSLAAEWTPCL